MNELNLVMILAGCACMLTIGIVIKNSFDRFADEIKTEVACLATKNNNDIQDMLARLKSIDHEEEKLYIKIYGDDSTSQKAEKLYQICEDDDELLNVLMQLKDLVEEEKRG